MQFFKAAWWHEPSRRVLKNKLTGLTSLNCTMWGWTRLRWFKISLRTYLVICMKHMLFSLKYWEGCRNRQQAVSLTLGPRLMNLMATCSPVCRSSARTTTPNAPRLTSFTCTNTFWQFRAAYCKLWYETHAGIKQTHLSVLGMVQQLCCRIWRLVVHHRALGSGLPIQFKSAP